MLLYRPRLCYCRLWIQFQPVELTDSGKKQSNARINAAIEYYGNAMDDVTKKFSSGRINYEQFRKLSKEISEASFAITETIEEAYKVYDFQIKYTDKIPVKE